MSHVIRLASIGFALSLVIGFKGTTFLGPFAAAQPAKEEAPSPLPPEIVKAWSDAGFMVTWMKDVPPKTSAWGFWHPQRGKAEVGAIPAFSPDGEVPKVLTALPDPGTPFGLDFHCGSDRDIPLKEFTKLKNLHSLNIGAVRSPNRRLAYPDFKDLAGMTNLRALYLFCLPVKDADLKYVAELKHLQALDLSDTQVTDAGLKELAGMKSLRWLNASTHRVTAAGIAALQKELPNCKITTYVE